MQNGDWVEPLNGGLVVYAFNTLSANGISLYGYNAVPFPQSVSTALGANTALGTNGVACSNSFNSTLSLASTVVYLSSNTYANVIIVTDNAMEVFFKPVPPTSSAWSSVFKGSAWGTGSAATQFGPNVLNLNKGLYCLEVLWENTCGPGVQEFALLEQGTGASG